jgi:Do/DeqQ family serine protease
MSLDFFHLRPSRRATAWTGAALVAATLGVANWQAGGASAETPAAAAQAQPEKAPAAAGPRVGIHGAVTSYADAVARVAPAVVTVRVDRKAQPEPTDFPDDSMLRRFFGERMPAPERQPRERGLGSGVIVSSDGRILTNAHVVEGAEHVRVELNDGREFRAKVIGVDAPSDLAVIDVEAQNLPALSLGDSNSPRVGDVVLAVGNPLGVGQTVTMGILSAKGRMTEYGDGSYQDFLQTDAPINRGNSGGALVTASGELIGITSQILSQSGGNIGIGFAIPATMAKRVMTELVSTGHVRRSMIGVTVQPVTADIATSLHLADVRGALVNSVAPESPAARAGIETGDVITTFNGVAVNNGNELRNLVSSTAPGSAAEVTVIRDQKPRQVRVTLVERQAEEQASKAGGAPGEDGLGMAVQPLTPRLAQQLEVPRATEGVAVTGVDPDGAAAAAGIQEGDVIRQVNGKSVHTPSELKQAVTARSGRPDLFLVQRGDQSFFATVDRG